MSESPSDPAPDPDLVRLSTPTLFTGIGFFLIAGMLAATIDVGLASLSALLGGGVILLALADDRHPAMIRLGVACTALGAVASFVHVLLRVLGP